MPAESIKKELGEKFLIALHSHDWDLMRTIMAPDVVWTLSGPNRISGVALHVNRSQN